MSGLRPSLQNGGHHEHKGYGTTQNMRTIAIAAEAVHPGKEALKAQGADSACNSRTHHLAQQPMGFGSWDGVFDQMAQPDNDEHGTRTYDAVRTRSEAAKVPWRGSYGQTQATPSRYAVQR
jgi:hypothetical protein